MHVHVSVCLTSTCNQARNELSKKLVASECVIAREENFWNEHLVLQVEARGVVNRVRVFDINITCAIALSSELY